MGKRKRKDKGSELRRKVRLLEIRLQRHSLSSDNGTYFKFKFFTKNLTYLCLRKVTYNINLLFSFPFPGRFDILIIKYFCYWLTKLLLNMLMFYIQYVRLGSTTVCTEGTIYSGSGLDSRYDQFGIFFF